MTSFPFPTHFQASYPQYFATNDPLSSEDATKFTEDVITPAIANLAAVDAEIFRLKATLSTMYAQSSRLQCDLSGYKTRRSVFHHFPPEVLAKVFYWFGFTSTSILCTRQGPWVLSQVCNRWRRVVFSQPSLWTDISIDEKDRGKPARSVNFLKQAISLSGELPLRLHLEMPHSMWAYSEACQFWLNELKAVSNRWQYLFLHCSIEVLDALCDVRRLGRLERLVLRMGDDDHESVSGTSRQSRTYDLFRDAPRLTSVALKQTRSRIQLPLLHLTHFRHYGDSQNQSHSTPGSFDWLDRCASLTELRIVTENRQYLNLPMIIRLESLRSLHFSDCRMLDSIDAPYLQALHCAMPYDEDQHAYNDPTSFECHDALLAIQRFLTRTQCVLQILSILDCPVESTELLFDILQLAPLLSMLDLKYLH